jgi:hypothetical protein
MDPFLATGVVLLSWLAVRRRSTGSRLLMASVLLMLGWEPAARGDRFGIVALLAGGGVAASVVADIVVAHVVRRPVRLGLRRLRSHTHDPTARPSPSRGEPLTELEQAQALGDLLDANILGLLQAKDDDDVRAQAAFSGEIARLATDMHALLRFVLGERQRLSGR